MYFPWFILMLYNIPLCGNMAFIQSTVDKHLVKSWLWIITNIAAMNTAVWVFWWVYICISAGYIPLRKILGLKVLNGLKYANAKPCFYNNNFSWFFIICLQRVHLQQLETTCHSTSMIKIKEFLEASLNLTFSSAYMWSFN